MKTLAGALTLGCWLLSVALARAETAPVEGGRIHYETCGSAGEALVLLHDGVLHSASFDAVWPALCSRYRVVRYDRRGYGRSAAATQPYSALEDLAAVMKAAGTERATLVGSSFGGGLAVSFALAHPEAVERLVLIGPAVGGLPVSDHFRRRTIAVQSALRSGGVAEAVKDPYIFAPAATEPRARAAALLTANPQNLTHPDPQRPPPSARPQLGSLAAPVLILVGESDIADVHAWAGALEALVPRARRIVVPGAGHLVQFEQPATVVEEIAAFTTAR